jgi:hypothetical protein
MAYREKGIGDAFDNLFCTDPQPSAFSLNL